MTDVAQKRPSGGGDEEESKRRRKTRWGDEDAKVSIPGVPTSLPSNMSSAEQESFVVQLRLEEISRKLRTGDVVPPENERSPSPEPQYDRDGTRLNTREKRYRKKLEEERQQLIEQAVKKDTTGAFKPPADYKKPTKYKEKVYIPQKDFPEINFIGQLIGPRGNTLKRLEREAGGVKIFIRGKGSVKEGKNQLPHPDDNDDLHCFVTADSEDKVRKAVQAILEVVEIAKSVPEELNERKKMQLMELAALNGTLRSDDKIICRNCGEMGHRDRECPNTRNITNNTKCTLCGGGGHLRQDCFLNNNPQGQQIGQMYQQQASVIDNEYHSLLKEIDGKDSTAGAQGSAPAAASAAAAVAAVDYSAWAAYGYQVPGAAGTGATAAWPGQAAGAAAVDPYAAWGGYAQYASNYYSYGGAAAPATGYSAGGNASAGGYAAAAYAGYDGYSADGSVPYSQPPPPPPDDAPPS